MEDPMVAMSRAIRGVIEKHGEGGTAIADVPTKELCVLADITQAYAYDMQNELKRRGSVGLT